MEIWRIDSKKTPKLLISKTPSSESKKVELSYRQGVSYE